MLFGRLGLWTDSFQNGSGGENPALRQRLGPTSWSPGRSPSRAQSTNLSTALRCNRSRVAGSIASSSRRSRASRRRPGGQGRQHGDGDGPGPLVEGAAAPEQAAVGGDRQHGQAGRGGERRDAGLVGALLAGRRRGCPRGRSPSAGPRPPPPAPPAGGGAWRSCRPGGPPRSCPCRARASPRPGCRAVPASARRPHRAAARARRPCRRPIGAWPRSGPRRPSAGRCSRPVTRRRMPQSSRSIRMIIPAQRRIGASSQRRGSSSKGSSSAE